jgi:hypothetical protein
MPYPTELSAQDWTTLSQLISGNVPPTAQMIAVAYDAEGLCLSQIFPVVPPAPTPVPVVVPPPVVPMTKPQAAAFCHAMASANGKKSFHAQAMGTFNWGQLLTIIQQILQVVTPIVTAAG